MHQKVISKTSLTNSEKSEYFEQVFANNFLCIFSTDSAWNPTFFDAHIEILN
jgi:hypothetical protein